MEEKMAEVLRENAEALSKNLNNQADRINSLINEFAELKEAIDKNKQNRYYWKSQFSALSISIWLGQVKYKQLEKKEAQVRQAVSESMKVIDLKQQELKELKAKRREYTFEQCDNFRVKYSNYTDSIVRAHKEYSTENLLQDIERYREKYRNAEREYLTSKKRLESLTTWYNFHCLSTEDIEEILKINTVLADIKIIDSKELQSITLAQSTLEKLKDEIEQKKVKLSDFKK